MSEAMAGLSAQDKRDIGDFLGRTWGWLLTAGILTALLGAVVLIWPEETVLVVAYLLGAYLIIAGVIQLVQSFTGDRSGGIRALLAIGGVLSLILGVFAFRAQAQAVALLAIVIGVAWLINGIATLMTAIADKGLPGRGWAMTSGVIEIIGGLVILLWPSITLFVLFTFFGIWLVVIGLVQIWAAFRMRGQGRQLAAA